MDGKACLRANVFIERLWRSINYEEVDVHPTKAWAKLRTGIRCYISSTTPAGPNGVCRPRTRDFAYFDSLPRPLAG